MTARGGDKTTITKLYGGKLLETKWRAAMDELTDVWARHGEVGLRLMDSEKVRHAWLSFKHPSNAAEIAIHREHYRRMGLVLTHDEVLLIRKEQGDLPQ